MFTSLFAPEVQAVLDNAESAAGQAGGPFPSPADWRDQVIYFLMVDRFNNPAKSPVHQPYDDPFYAQYQGGRFSGVQQQLAYIKSLGAGAVWLSPVLKNLPFDTGSYHGYGIHDFLRAEPCFATNPANADDELRALVDAAHQAGLYVIFDIVLNHIGDAFAYNGNSTAPFSSVPMPIQWRDASGTAQPQWNDIAAIQNPPIDGVVWPSELHQNQYFRRQGMPDPNGADTVGDFDSLKQMMTVDPDLQGFLIRAYQYVIARYDIDGFRIDTLRYLQGNLPQLFGNSVREFALSIGKKNFFTFGEVLDSNEEEDIVRFIGRNTTTGSDADSLVGVDAALDYPLFNVLTPTIKGFSAPAAVVAMYNRRKQVEQYILSSHGDASRFFVTFVDNHDMKGASGMCSRAMNMSLTTKSRWAWPVFIHCQEFLACTTAPSRGCTASAPIRRCGKRCGASRLRFPQTVSFTWRFRKSSPCATPNRRFATGGSISGPSRPTASTLAFHRIPAEYWHGRAF